MRCMTPSVSSILVPSILAATILASSGCSGPARPPLGSVEGTVTLDGQPLAGAAVLFTPEGPGRTSIGITDSSGHYTLVYLRDIKGADVGRHTVRITTATDDNNGRERLPKRYHATSKLTASVENGPNHHDFALSSKP